MGLCFCFSSFPGHNKDSRITAVNKVHLESQFIIANNSCRLFSYDLFVWALIEKYEYSWLTNKATFFGAQRSGPGQALQIVRLCWDSRICSSAT